MGQNMSYVKKIIDDWDPIGLLSHAPDDEYQTEIEEIQQLLKISDDTEILSEGIFCIFDKAFGKDIFLNSREDCERIARILISHKITNDTSKG